MKSLFATSILVISVFFAFGQIQWNSSDEAGNGQSANYYLIDSNTVDLASTTGNGVMWDYSTIAAYSVDLKQLLVETAASSPYASAYTGATDRLNYLDKFQDFYTISSPKKEGYGIVFNEPSFGDIVVHHDAHDVKTYPWSLNSQVSGSLSNAAVDVTNPVPNSYSAAGAYSIKCDGFGTLILGDSTIDSVIRTYYFDSLEANLGILGKLYLVRHQFEYYRLGNAFPLFFHSSAEIQSAVLNSEFSMVLSQIRPNLIYGVKEFNHDLGINLFPNPAGSILQIQFKNPLEVNQLEIYDLQGKLILQKNYSGPNSTINLSVEAFNPGLYNILIRTEDGMGLEKFLKE